MTVKTTVPYSQLLKEAVSKEGVLSSCYSRFHNYSIGNQIWAWLQSIEHKLDLGPDRKSTRLNSSHIPLSRMPSSA